MKSVIKSKMYQAVVALFCCMLSLSACSGGGDGSPDTGPTAPINHAPTANSFTLTLEGNVPKEVDVIQKSGLEDPDGDPLTCVSDGATEGVTVDDIGDGKADITASSNLIDSDTLVKASWTCTDPYGEKAAFNANIEAINTAPEASNFSLTCSGGQGVDFNPANLSGLSDANGDPLELTEIKLQNSDHGTLSPGANEGEYTFTANNAYSGSVATISITFTDSHGATVTIAVSINILNNAPEGNQTTADVECQGGSFILLNPFTDFGISDPNGDTMEIDQDQSSANNGTLTFGADGSIRFTPDKSFKGATQITIVVKDQWGRSYTATYVINVTNTPPIVGQVNDSFEGGDGSSYTFNPTQLFDPYDPNTGDTVTLSSCTQSSGAPGVLQNNYDGTYSVYPLGEYIGSYGDVTCKFTDGEATTDGVASITVDNGIPEGIDAQLTMTGDSLDFDAVTECDVQDPNDGEITIKSFTVPSSNAVVVQINDTTRELRVTSLEGNKDLITIDVVFQDSDGGKVAQRIEVTIEAAPNHAPTAEDMSITLFGNSSITFDGLAGASDLDGDTLTITGVSLPSHGFALNIGGSNVKYQPNGGYTGLDSFTITISDGKGGEATRTVYVTVQ